MNVSTLLNTPGAVIVDVREAGEFQGGHLDGSINIPLSQLGQSIDRYRQLGRPLILVCRSGARSGMVTDFLRGQGMREVYNGGAWTALRSIRRSAA